MVTQMRTIIAGEPNGRNNCIGSRHRRRRWICTVTVDFYHALVSGACRHLNHQLLSTNSDRRHPKKRVQKRIMSAETLHTHMKMARFPVDVSISLTLAEFKASKLEASNANSDVCNLAHKTMFLMRTSRNRFDVHFVSRTNNWYLRIIQVEAGDFVSLFSEAFIAKA